MIGCVSFKTLGEGLSFETNQDFEPLRADKSVRQVETNTYLIPEEQQTVNLDSETEE